MEANKFGSRLNFQQTETESHQNTTGYYGQIHKRTVTDCLHHFIFFQSYLQKGDRLNNTRLFLTKNKSSQARYQKWLRKRHRHNEKRPPQTGVAFSELSIGQRIKPGGDLLSHGETPHYHRRWMVSLLSSRWDQVVPKRCGRRENWYASSCSIKQKAHADDETGESKVLQSLYVYIQPPRARLSGNCLGVIWSSLTGN